MLVRGSRKLHPELDLDQARRVFVEARVHERITGEMITSPHDLFSVETLRDAHGLRIGKACPTDVFVFGWGESPRRDGTKVGGTPYWPADRPWPSSAAGKPCLFLAQFNFADSPDLLPDLPGDVLLLLLEDAQGYLREPAQIRFEWLPLGLPTASDFNDLPSALKAGPFYGVIRRSADYPDVTERADALDIPGGYNLPVLNGTKIGGVPHFIQAADEGTGECLCQLGSVQAHARVPYPWVNRAEPLGLEFDERGIYGRGNSAVFGDMGTIYVFRDRDGSMRSAFQCY